MGHVDMVRLLLVKGASVMEAGKVGGAVITTPRKHKAAGSNAMVMLDDGGNVARCCMVARGATPPFSHPSSHVSIHQIGHPADLSALALAFLCQPGWHQRAA